MLHDANHRIRNHRFYASKAWQVTRKIILESEPLCRHCMQENRLTPATVVDHIITISTLEGWNRRLDKTNLQPLCEMHHNRKTATEQAANRPDQKEQEISYLLGLVSSGTTLI